MKFSYLLMLSMSLFLSSLTAQITTPQASPLASTSQDIGLAKATIEYSRPSLKGRKMVGNDLVPFGQVWRTGANKVPNLILSKDVTIEGNKVPAGTYGVLTIPNATEWTVILSKNAKQWGAYEYKQAEDLLRFNVKSEKLATTVEHFTMAFDNFTNTSANLVISWENTQIKCAIAHDPKADILAEIKTKTAAADATADTYFDAADYYFQNNQDLKQAFDWSNKVVEKSKEYWTYYLRAKIAAKLGKCDIAVADATAGLELAKKEKDAAYVGNLTKVLEGCKK